MDDVRDRYVTMGRKSDLQWERRKKTFERNVEDMRDC